MFTYNYNGIIIGLITFILIGLLHPLVIKGEYYFGKRLWFVFLFTGLLCLICSILVNNFIISSCLGISGFMLLWSIKEIFEQEKRVLQGRFPKNPKRVYPAKIS